MRPIGMPASRAASLRAPRAPGRRGIAARRGRRPRAHARRRSARPRGCPGRGTPPASRASASGRDRPRTDARAAPRSGRATRARRRVSRGMRGTSGSSARRLLEGGAEPGQPGAARLRPVHQLQRFEPRRRSVCGPVRQRRVQHVQHRAAGGRVRAEPVGIGRELRVHRADRDRGRAMPGGRAHEIRERREIADPAVARPPQAVELHRQSPGVRLAPSRRRSTGSAAARSRACRAGRRLPGGGSRGSSIGGRRPLAAVSPSIDASILAA